MGTQFDHNPHMTTEEVAAYFRVGKSTVYSWANRGLLQSAKVGGARRWLRQSVLDLASRSLAHERSGDAAGRRNG